MKPTYKIQISINGNIEKIVRELGLLVLLVFLLPNNFGGG